MKLLISLTLAAALLVTAAHAGTFVAFTETYVRDTNSPDLITTNFTANPNTTYVMRITNGGLVNGQYEHVSSSIFKLNSMQVVGQNEFNQNVSVIEKPVTLLSSNTLSVEVRGKPGGAINVQIMGTDNDPPVITITSPADGATVNSAQLIVTGTVTDPLSGVGAVNCNGTPATIAGSSFSCDLTLTAGINTISFQAVDLAGNSSAVSITVIFASVPAFSSLKIIPSSVTILIGDFQRFKVKGILPNGSIQEVSGFASFTSQNSSAATINSFGRASGLTQGTATITATVNGQSVTAQLQVIERYDPPSPEAVATPVDLSIVTTVASSTEFLYTGNDPIQRGVAPGTIQANRVAILRGKVIVRDSTSFSGAKVTVLDHSEFGLTLSRADGGYDLAVNGGGTMTIVYEKTGYLPVQRTITVPWEDYVNLGDVALIPFDSIVNALDLSQPMQVARGSVVTDQDGTRRSTLLFPQQVARMVMPNGSEQQISTIHVRATEFTVGPNGPNSMPADLPPTSAYTYAVEFSVDEAVAVGAKEVRFAAPVINYLENFLNLPVGIDVPVAYYDREKAAWVPTDNGRIIKVVGVTSGLADLDITGDSAADNGLARDALGVSDLERQQVALLYQTGQSL